MILVSTVKVMWPISRLCVGNPLSWMNLPSMTTSIIFNRLQNSAKKAFPLNYRPKKKMLSDKIHNFWNSNPKSNGSKGDEALRARSKPPKAKLGRIEPA